MSYQLTIEQLALGIHEQINKSILDFQKFLSQEKVYSHPSLVKVFHDILTSQIHTQQNKKLASTSLFYPIKKQVDSNYEKYLPILWQQYVNCFLSKQTEKIECKYLFNTIKTLQYLFQEWGQEFNFKSMTVYCDITFQAKLLFYEAYLSMSDIPPETQFMFFRQSIQEFLQQGWQFMRQFHAKCQNRPLYSYKEEFSIQEKFMKILYQWFRIIEEQQVQYIEQSMNQLAKRSIIAQIVDQKFRMVLTFCQNDLKMNFIKLNLDLNEKFGFTFLNVDLMNIKGIENKQLMRLFLNIKNYALGWLKIFSSRFLSHSGLIDFDDNKILGLLEYMTPILINLLNENTLLKDHYFYKDHSQFTQQIQNFTINAFNTLERSTRYNFLFQIHSSHADIILHSILFSYLRTNQDQLQEYQYEGARFVATNENFFEIPAYDQGDTAKQACAKFFQQYFITVNQIQIPYLEYLAAVLRYWMNKQPNPLEKLQNHNNFQIISVQLVYLVITRIYTFFDKKNKVFIQFLYNNFIKPQFVFNYQGIQKARFYMFLTYCFDKYFKHDPEFAIKYLEDCYQSRNINDGNYAVCLQLFQQGFLNGLSSNLWSHLMKNVQNAKQPKQIILISTIVTKYHQQLDRDSLSQILQLICQKTISQFKQTRQIILQDDGQTNLIISCLNIIQFMVQKKQILRQIDQMVGSIVGMIDFFFQNEIDRFTFHTNVIKILILLLEYVNEVPLEFRRYLETLGKIVKRHRHYGDILLVYYQILLKGGQAFNRDPSFLQEILHQAEEIVIQPFSHQQLLIQSLFLIQNIYLVYPQYIQQNRLVYESTQQIYLKMKQDQVKSNGKCIASLILYWMAAQYTFGNYTLQPLRDLKIDIFQHQFCSLFALCIKKLIQKYYDTVQLQMLIKLGLKIIDYEHYFKKQKYYKGPQYSLSVFKHYLVMDTFQQISQAVNFLKNNLPRLRFLQLADMMKHELDSHMVTQLLSTRIFDQKERKIVTIKRE